MRRVWRIGGQVGAKAVDCDAVECSGHQAGRHAAVGADGRRVRPGLERAGLRWLKPGAASTGRS